MFSTLAKNENAHEQGIWSLKWHQQHLITGGADGVVKVWDSQLKELNCFKHHSLSILNVDAYNNKAISHSFDGTFCCFDLETGNVQKTLEFAPVDCFHTQISKDLIARTAHDGSITIMDFNGVTKYKLQGKKDVFVFSCCFSNDGKKLAAGYKDGTVAIFDVETQKLLHSISVHENTVRQVVVSPNQEYLITASYDKKTAIIDFEHGNIITTYAAHTSWVLTADCHPTQPMIATGSADHTVRLYDFKAGNTLQVYEDNSDQIWKVQFNQTGDKLATCSDDKNLRIYRTQ